MSFYALLTAGFFLAMWALIVKNTGGYGSLFVVKLLPAAIGIWCLWEAALLFLSDKV